MNRISMGLLCGAGIAALTAPVHAQTSNPAPAAQSGGSSQGGVEEIVVTAQKRSENLQKVPISVSAITAGALQASGIKTVEGIATALPGITMTRQSAATMIYIRGIGTTGGQAGQDGAVATFVDGVYQPSMSGSTFALNNIERIEVLKGPQGTLYGRNATGGAVNIITRQPSHTPEIDAEFGYGNRHTFTDSAYVTGGITNTIAADLAIYYSNIDHGYGRNTITGNYVNTRKDYAFRSKVLFEPSDATKITLAADYTKDAGSYGVSFRPIPGTTRLLIGPAAPQANFYNIDNDIDPYLHTENWGGSARIEQELSFAKLTSISAYRKVDQFQRLDLDFGPLPLFEAALQEKNNQFTQEIQLASLAGSKIQWIGGLFYLNGQSRYDPYTVFGQGFLANGVYGNYNHPQMDTQSYAVFGQATIPLFDENTHLTVGGRYTIDKRKLRGDAGFVLADMVTHISTFNLRDNATFKKPTWRIALDHKLSDDVMLYGSYSRGFKSGVYNLSGPTTTDAAGATILAPVVKPETLDAFEAGIKSELLDRHLRVNLAGFYYLYKNIQLTIIQGPNQTLLNAAKAKVYGLDADFDAVLSPNFSLHGGGEVIHGRYSSFPSAPISSRDFAFPYGDIIVQGPASGNKLVKTPDFSANVSADLHAPIGENHKIALNVGYSYNSGFYFEPDNRLRQKAYSLVNAQLRLATRNDSVYIRAFVTNLTNTHYWTQQTTVFTGDLGDPAYGRQYGGAIGFKF